MQGSELHQPPDVLSTSCAHIECERSWQAVRLVKLGVSCIDMDRIDSESHVHIAYAATNVAHTSAERSRPVLQDLGDKLEIEHTRYT